MKKKPLAEYHPELIPEWSSKNDPVKIDTIGSGYRDKYWWICSKGHEWQASPGSRVAGHGCPYCAGIKVWAGEKDLALTHPEIASEWDPKNKLKPTEITAKCHHRVWWICPDCGYNYQMQVIRRTERGGGCPICTEGHAYTGSTDILSVKPELASEWDYERNSRPPSTYAAGSRFRVWWKGSCGHSYRAAIRDKFFGIPCPICERKKDEHIPEKAFMYYLGCMNARYISNDQDITGLPIEIYLPDNHSAIEFWHKSQETDYAYSRERCKNIACRQAGVKMIRIMPRNARVYDNCLCILQPDDSIRNLEQAMSVAFKVIGIYDRRININLSRDMEAIRKIEFEQMRLNEYQ